MKEYLLSTNAYLEPDIVKDANAYAILLVRLLLLEPGTNPLHPDMGVGIGPKYRFILDKDIPTLQAKIESQIATYMPSEFKDTATVTLSLNAESKYLSIVIEAYGVRYVYDTENSNTPIELSNLIKNK